MKRLRYFGGLVIFAIGFVFVLSQILGVDLKVYFKVLVDLFVFACEIILAYLFFAYVAYRIASERKIRHNIEDLSIPVKVIRLPFPGFRLPYQCYDPECKGVLISTIICEPHSLAGEDGKVFFSSSDNLSRISIGLIAKCRQGFGGMDRIFCTDCGTEYDWRVIRPKDHPLNLYKILPH